MCGWLIAHVLVYVPPIWNWIILKYLIINCTTFIKTICDLLSIINSMLKNRQTWWSSSPDYPPLNPQTLVDRDGCLLCDGAGEVLSGLNSHEPPASDLHGLKQTRWRESLISFRSPRAAACGALARRCRTSARTIIRSQPPSPSTHRFAEPAAPGTRLAVPLCPLRLRRSSDAPPANLGPMSRGAVMLCAGGLGGGREDTARLLWRPRQDRLSVLRREGTPCQFQWLLNPPCILSAESTASRAPISEPTLRDREARTRRTVAEDGNSARRGTHLTGLSAHRARAPALTTVYYALQLSENFPGRCLSCCHMWQISFLALYNGVSIKLV